MDQTFWIWVLLLLMISLGAFTLYFASEQMKKLKKFHAGLLDKLQTVEHNQHQLHAEMSKNLDRIQTAPQLQSYPEEDHTVPNNNIEAIFNDETVLLDVANDLIEFLRLKSGKVNIVNEKFNINNVLNEVSGMICSTYEGSRVELIFDIDNSVPRLLMGDSAHIGKILNNLPFLGPSALCRRTKLYIQQDCFFLG